VAASSFQPLRSEPSAPGGHPAGPRGTSHATWPASPRPGRGRAGRWICSAADRRAHGDIEIAIPAASFPEVRSRFPGYVFDAAGSGRIWEDATPDELASVHQTWLRDPATGNYLLDVFRGPHDGDTWICRRDESIRFPYSEIIYHTQDSIPYLAPELVLLFKAKHARQKDQADFDATIPHMTPAQRETLGELLARAHPEHRWLADLVARFPGPLSRRGIGEPRHGVR
jgi:hypothetical protein